MKVPNFTFCRGRERKTTTFFFFSWPLIGSFRIQLLDNLATFDQLNEVEQRDKVWGSANSHFKWRFCSRRRRCCLSFLLGTLRSNDADGNENVKKAIGLISKTTTSHVHHAFLYISFLFLHDYDVKMPNWTFNWGRKQATTKFYFSFWAWIRSLEIQLQEGSPTFDKVRREE